MNEEDAHVMLEMLRNVFQQGNMSFTIDEEPRLLSETQYRFIEHYLDVVLNIEGPLGNNILVPTQHAMQINQTYTPSPKQIATEIMKNPCQCLRISNTATNVNACEHILTEFKISPTCELIEGVLLYHMAENKYPNIEELAEMISNNITISQQPETYCQDKRLLVPTPHMEKLIAIKNEKNDVNCSICLDQIKLAGDMYQLPCGDCFHAGECLGGGQSILTWMDQCKRCPNCNQEIILNMTEKYLH
jgi:hypothetical protein